MTTTPDGREPRDLPAGPADERAYRRDAERWLAAYPPRWRRQRAEEVLGVLLDTRPPGADRLDRRTRWDLLRGGASYRWRGRPPPAAWLVWRMWEVPLPERCRAWGMDDVEGRWLWLRQLVSPPALLFVVVMLAGGLWATVFGGVLLTSVMALSFATRSWVRERRRKLLVDEHVAAPGVGGTRAPRRRVSAGRWLWWPVAATVVGLLLAVGIARAAAGHPMAAAAGLLPPSRSPGEADGWPVMSVMLLVVLLPQLAAPFVHPRGRLSGRPSQPHRRPLSSPPTWALVVGCIGLASLPVLASTVGVVAAVGTPSARRLLEAGAAPLAVLLLLAALYVATAAATLRLVAARAERRHPGPPVALRDVLDLSGWDQIPVDQPEAVPVAASPTDYFPYPSAPGAERGRPTTG